MDGYTLELDHRRPKLHVGRSGPYWVPSTFRDSERVHDLRHITDLILQSSAECRSDAKDVSSQAIGYECAGSSDSWPSGGSICEHDIGLGMSNDECSPVKRRSLELSDVDSVIQESVGESFARAAAMASSRGQRLRSSSHVSDSSDCQSYNGLASSDEHDWSSTDDDFACCEPIKDDRCIQETGTSSPADMLEYMRLHESTVADITHLSLNIGYVCGSPNGETIFQYLGYDITERRAKELEKAGLQVVRSPAMRPATPEDIAHAQDKWVEMLHVLSEQARNIRVLHVTWRGYEHATSVALIKALALLEVSQRVTLHGTYGRPWIQFLEEQLNVPVRQGPGSWLVPIADAFSVLDLRQTEEAFWAERGSPLEDSQIHQMEGIATDVDCDDALGSDSDVSDDSRSGTLDDGSAQEAADSISCSGSSPSATCASIARHRVFHSLL